MGDCLLNPNNKICIHRKLCYVSDQAFPLFGLHRVVFYSTRRILTTVRQHFILEDSTVRTVPHQYGCYTLVFSAAMHKPYINY